MHWCSDFSKCMTTDVPLAPLTWFRVGGPARYFARPSCARDLSQIFQRAIAEDMTVKVLGGGANVLVADKGFDGVVLRLDDDAFRSVDVDGDIVTVGGGVDLMPLCRQLSEQGLSGLEGLAGIPGTIGGAVRMNAGGRFGEMADTVVSAEVLTSDGVVETWSRQRLAFGYRHSAIRSEIVVSARLQLQSADPDQTGQRYAALLTHKRHSQPMADKSAGCIFKNPKDASAGALIDQAGLKGARAGLATVSTCHANFIVAEAGAKASDILCLIEIVRNRVSAQFGITLETEVDIWGR